MDLVQGSSCLCHGACDLMYKHGSGHTSASHCVQTVLYRHIVIGHHILHGDAFHLGHLSGHLKIHHIAGIVLDYHEHACVRGNGLDSLINLVRGRRCEHCAGHSRVQHTASHISAVSRFMPASSSADQGHLSFLLIGSDHHIAAVQLSQITRIRLNHTLYHLILYQRHIVDKFLHIA